MVKRKRRTTEVKQENKPTRLPNSIVDIIIPVYQRFDLLTQCIESIPAACDDVPYRVYIFDNGSPEEAANAFYSKIDDRNIKIIRNKENIGFPRACNQAFNRGFSQLVFFLNSDVILFPKSVRYMAREMEESPSIGVIGMKLIFPEVTDLPQIGGQRPSGKVQHVGLETNIRADVYHQFLGWSPDNSKVLAVRNVYGVTGAAMLTTRSLFNRAGKFQEIYGMGTYEDMDYCLTVRKMGYNIIVCQDAVGIHYTGATSTAYNLYYPVNENKMIFMQRWQRELDWTEWRNA